MILNIKIRMQQKYYNMSYVFSRVMTFYTDFWKEFGLREPLQLSMEEICRDIQLSFPSL